MCDRSFGINVAAMAHFPRAVIEDAQSQAREYEFYQVLTAVQKDEDEEGSGPPEKKAKFSKEVGKKLEKSFTSPLGKFSALMLGCS